MSIPSDLRYTSEHEWVSLEDNLATVGITDYAQGELGDIVFVELPSVGDVVKAGSAFGTIEAVKAVSELFAPVSGKVAEINAELQDNPTVVNSDPYGDGWMIKIEVKDSDEFEKLLPSSEYEKLTEQD